MSGCLTLKPVSVDIEKRLAENSRAFPFKLLDEYENYRFYCDMGTILREDVFTGQVVSFGHGTNACIYEKMLYCYQWGSILSDKKVYRCELDGSNVEYLDLLSNNKICDPLGHLVSEDSVSQMKVEDHSLVIYVSRGFGEEKHKITITDKDGKLFITKEMIFKKESKPIPPQTKTIFSIESLPLLSLPNDKLFRKKKLNKYSENLFHSINNTKPESMVLALSGTGLFTVETATQLSLYSFGYSIGGLEYALRNVDPTEKNYIIDMLYKQFRNYVANNLLQPSVKGNRREELIAEVMEINTMRHEFTKLILTSNDDDWLEVLTSEYISFIGVSRFKTIINEPLKFQKAMLKLIMFSPNDIN